MPKIIYNKLEEETKEVVAAKNDAHDLIKEIGDVYEVIDAIIDNCGLDKDEIIKIKNQRKVERGGFNKKIFLESIDN